MRRPRPRPLASRSRARPGWVSSPIGSLRYAVLREGSHPGHGESPPPGTTPRRSVLIRRPGRPPRARSTSSIASDHAPKLQKLRTMDQTLSRERHHVRLLRPPVFQAQSIRVRAANPDLVACIDHRAVQVAGNRRQNFLGDDGHLASSGRAHPRAPGPAAPTLCPGSAARVTAGRRGRTGHQSLPPSPRPTSHLANSPAPPASTASGGRRSPRSAHSRSSGPIARWGPGKPALGGVRAHPPAAA